MLQEFELKCLQHLKEFLKYMFDICNKMFEHYKFLIVKSYGFCLDTTNSINLVTVLHNPVVYIAN